MQNWFLIALIGPILWAIVNHIDKYMLFKYFKKHGVHSLMVFSCLSAVVVLPFVLYFFGFNVLDVPFVPILILLFCGLFSAVGFYFYLRAMDMEEVSVVVPLFQLIPVFTYFLAYFILGESLSNMQILSSVIIMIGAIILSVEIDIDHSFIIKKKALFLVAISSFSFALYDTLFKKIALTEDFWVSIFWQYLGIFIVGLVLVLFFKDYRQSFKHILFPFKLKFFSINILSEILYILGNIATNYATLFVPVFLVLIVGSYQSVFTFIIAVLMTIFLPKIITERISRGHVIHRVISIAIILLGSYFLYISSN